MATILKRVRVNRSITSLAGAALIAACSGAPTEWEGSTESTEYASSEFENDGVDEERDPSVASPAVDDTEEPASIGVPETAQQENVVARVELGPETEVTFTVHTVEGEIAASTVGQAFRLSEGAPLDNPSLPDATLLELFTAISHETAPTALVTMHEESALRRGLDPEVIRDVTFSPQVLKTAFSTSQCTDFILDGYNNTPQVIANNVNLGILSAWDVRNYNPLRWVAGSIVKEGHSEGACADSAAASAQRRTEYRVINTGSWLFDSSALYAVPGGTARKFWGAPAEGWEIKVRLYTSGSDHHVRTGWNTVVSL